jgi:outer membrane beta-barrel protein
VNKSIFRLILFFWGCIASAQQTSGNTDAYDLPEVVVVENRQYQPVSDFGIHIGVLPMDAFYKAISFGFNYDRVYDSAWTWEMVNFQGAFKQDTGLKSDLINNFAVKPTGILDYVKNYGTTSVVYTPIYGKNLFFNKSIVHSELGFLLGAGVINFNSGDSAPIFGTGAQLRFFKSQTFSVKFDSRIFFHMANNKSSNFIMDVGFTFSFDTPGAKTDGKTL